MKEKASTRGRKYTREEQDGRNRRQFIRRAIQSPKQPRFSEAMQDAMEEAVPDLDVRDSEVIERVFEDRARNIYGYHGERKRSLYLAWAADWHSRIARLTVIAKSLLPELRAKCRILPSVVDQILLNLDDYRGNIERTEFRKWAVPWVENVEQNTVLFLEWHDSAACRSAVRAGIWSVLSECSDLGADSGTLDTLEGETWTKVFERLGEFATPGYSNTPGQGPATIETRLYGFAQDHAEGWRTEQLRHCDQFDDANVERIGMDEDGRIVVEPEFDDELMDV